MSDYKITEAEIVAEIEKTIKEWITDLTPEKVKLFLSLLPIQDSCGKLIKSNSKKLRRVYELIQSVKELDACFEELYYPAELGQ